ncbi:zinc transporter, ZIP family [Galdieria sulphuraria]|uniref:Zinc transporter, ZIP family n=1 Tax=Galdieria sulphuraria TaxID=130081 RepID=M2X3N7_GALSU|nr:zinc transporter, ZIP family [Galdieria sulphuraria]EME31035.1 zinc transporter, ZIP family [Galdieria sulphuraria]|eukprot:XP_005707555.1 zinc transporter, ZIP family [Galdieria sulphuraria]
MPSQVCGVWNALKRTVPNTCFLSVFVLKSCCYFTDKRKVGLRAHKSFFCTCLKRVGSPSYFIVTNQPPRRKLSLQPSRCVMLASEIEANTPVALLLTTLAGISTGIGGILVVLQSSLSYPKLGIWQGAAAGFMLSVSAFDLLPEALEEVSAAHVLFSFITGALFFILLKVLIPEPDLSQVPEIEGTAADKQNLKQVLLSGFLVAMGIAIHNFPEGIAVCFASLKGIRFGVPLAIAIGLHNIPEGMAVALPVYFATRSKYKAIQIAFLSGLAEPAGVVLVVFFAKYFLTETFVAYLLAAYR